MNLKECRKRNELICLRNEKDKNGRFKKKVCKNLSTI